MPKSSAPLRRILLLTAGAVLVGLAVLAAVMLGPGRDTAAKALAAQLVARIEAAGGTVGDWSFDAAESRLRLRELAMASGQWTLTAAGLDLSLTASALTGTLDRVEGEGITVTNRYYGTQVARFVGENVAIPPGVVTGEQGLDWRELTAASVKVEAIVARPKPAVEGTAPTPLPIVTADRAVLAGIVDGDPSELEISGLRLRSDASLRVVSLDRLVLGLDQEALAVTSADTPDGKAILATIDRLVLSGGTFSDGTRMIRLSEFDFSRTWDGGNGSVTVDAELQGLSFSTTGSVAPRAEKLAVLLGGLTMALSNRIQIADGILTGTTQVKLGNRLELTLETGLLGFPTGLADMVAFAKVLDTPLSETLRLQRVAVDLRLDPTLLPEVIEADADIRKPDDDRAPSPGADPVALAKAHMASAINRLTSIPGVEASETEAVVDLVEGGGRLRVVAGWPEGLPMAELQSEELRAEFDRILLTGDITITREP